MKKIVWTFGLISGGHPLRHDADHGVLLAEVRYEPEEQGLPRRHVAGAGDRPNEERQRERPYGPSTDVVWR